VRVGKSPSPAGTAPVLTRTLQPLCGSPSLRVHDLLKAMGGELKIPAASPKAPWRSHNSKRSRRLPMGTSESEKPAPTVLSFRRASAASQAESASLGQHHTLHHRGRAALQRRVTAKNIDRASAPVRLPIPSPARSGKSHGRRTENHRPLPQRHRGDHPIRSGQEGGGRRVS